MSALRPIDLRELVRGKNESLAAGLPSGTYRLLELLLHLRQINAILARFGHLEGHAFVRAVEQVFGARVGIEGREFLTGPERPIFVANHPLGGLDGIVLMRVIGDYHANYVIPVNDFLMSIPNLRPGFVPINKHGSNQRYMADLRRCFESDRAIINFPAGLCSRRRAGRIRDLEWKKTFVSRARATGRPIVPVYVSGRNSRLFYALANLRARTGLRFNAEMILLPREMFRARNRTLTVRFGPPIDAAALSRTLPDAMWARLIRRFVYAIGDRFEGTFTDFLADIGHGVRR